MVIAKAPRAGQRGRCTAGLLRYLFGPGRANEHTDPHLLAASAPEWLPGGPLAARLGQRGGLAQLARQLDAHQRGHAVEVPGGHVYHVAISLPVADGRRDEAWWRAVVENSVEQMGFGPDAEGAGGCEWVAVHHGLSTGGNDHVHLVVNLVRSDGRIAETYRDWPRWRRWCRALEQQHGLTPTAPVGAGRAATSRARRERTRRVAGVDVELEHAQLCQLVHAAAVEAISEGDFVALLAARGVRYRPRLSPQGLVTGYAVALDGGTTPRWISASRLRRDLSLPKLRRRWPHASQPPEVWSAVRPPPPRQRAYHPGTWPRIQRELATAHEQLSTLRRLAGAQVWWHQTAGGLSDFLVVFLPTELDGGPLHQAHEHLTRAGQPPHATPRPAPGARLVPALFDAVTLAAHARSPTATVLAAVLLLVAVLVSLLAEVAERQRVHHAARRDLHAAARVLHQHPLVRESPAVERPVSRRSAAAQIAAAAAAPPTPGGATLVRPSAGRRPARAVPPRSPQQPPKRGRAR